MKINQYFITNDTSTSIVDVDFGIQIIDNFKIYYHKNLKAERFSYQNNALIILGDVFDPFNPEASNKSIGSELIIANSLDAILKTIDKLTGRFIMFLNVNGSYYVLSDFFGQRQVFYWFNSDCFYASSSPKLLLDTLNLDLEIEESKLALSKSNYFLKIHEHWFLGETDWDSRLNKLLPNHYLNINEFKTLRIPIYVSKTSNREGLEQEVLLMLKNSIEAYSKRYSLMLGLTSGYDSRLIMAVSYPFKSVIKYFTFKRNDTYVKRDVTVAKQIAETYNLDYKTIRASELSFKFIEDFNTQFLIPRLLDKTKNIQWFKEQCFKNTANISGFGGELIRGFYNEEDFITTNSICKAIEYKMDALNKNDIDLWLKECKAYSGRNDICISDLFYLEIRLGKWGNKMIHELDFAEIEEFSPYNNRYLMYSICLNYNIEERKLITLNLMEQSLKDITKIPFNPKTWKDTIKKIIFYEYYKKWIQRLK